MNKTEENTKSQAVRLSGRLQAVADFVPQGCCLADVGTDHGYIPIYLIQQKTAKKALAMDVRKGPLDRARAHIGQLPDEQQSRLKVRLSDGLKELRPGEADTVVIAGMGGELMMRILEEGSFLWQHLDRYILAPQSELGKFRHFLADNGFVICRENMVCEDGKYYTVMDVTRGRMSLTREIEALYGPCLLAGKHPVLKEYLDREERRVLGILEALGRQAPQESEGRQRARRELQQELEQIREAQHEMQ